MGGFEFDMIDSNTHFGATCIGLPVHLFDQFVKEKRYLYKEVEETEKINFAKHTELPFQSFEELYCFLLVNHYGVTKEAYNFMLQMLKSSLENNKEIFDRFVSYDTLREKRKILKAQQPTHFNDKFLTYSLEETAVNILKDVYHAKEMCLNFTDFDRSTGQNEPYQSKIFSESVERNRKEYLSIISYSIY